MQNQQIKQAIKSLQNQARAITEIARGCELLGLTQAGDTLQEATRTIFLEANAIEDEIISLEVKADQKAKDYDFDDDIPF